MDREVEAIIAILTEEGKPLSYGCLAFLLEERGVIPKANLYWEIDGPEERAWWQNIYNAISKAFHTGRVGQILTPNGKNSLICLTITKRR